MKKAFFPQKKKALLWGGLALACLLLFLLLRGLDNAPSLTLEQAGKIAPPKPRCWTPKPWTTPPFP